MFHPSIFSFIALAYLWEGGKGSASDALPFDWTGVDALVFDAYNPSTAPLELTLKVKSGLHGKAL